MVAAAQKKRPHLPSVMEGYQEKGEEPDSIGRCLGHNRHDFVPTTAQVDLPGGPITGEYETG